MGILEVNITSLDEIQVLFKNEIKLGKNEYLHKENEAYFKIIEIFTVCQLSTFLCKFQSDNKSFHFLY